MFHILVITAIIIIIILFMGIAKIKLSDGVKIAILCSLTIVGAFLICWDYTHQQNKGLVELRKLIKQEIQFIYPRVSDDWDSLYVDIAILYNAGGRYQEVERVTMGIPIIKEKANE